MGYYMEQKSSKFFIAKKDFSKALDAIKLLMTKVNELGHGGSYSNGSKNETWFSWVDTKTVVESNTLSDALEEWRYCVKIDKYGNINNIEFTGEKLGQEKLLFDAIAPFVRKGSYISMIGEDETRWKWIFKNNQCMEEYR
jgi:hypothetical protein